MRIIDLYSDVCSSDLVDLNAFPFEAVERMEVLQDGASAVYGSDAISGVVNVIMRRDYDGLLLKGGYGVSSRGDLPNYELSGTFGQKFDRGDRKSTRLNSSH